MTFYPAMFFLGMIGLLVVAIGISLIVEGRRTSALDAQPARVEPEERMVRGYKVVVDDQLGHLCVYHNDHLLWETLQAIKAEVWGPEARAIEVYPAASKVVNNVKARHLWRAGPFDFLPDLLGEDGHEDGLQSRYCAAWAEARR